MNGTLGSGYPGIELLELVLGSGKADSEALDLAAPALALGLGDAGSEVVADLLQPAALGRVRPEERATNTSLTELILKRLLRIAAAAR